jgi:two-component system, chemotaxis family, protein-glutamate methylesterase/glutaminase
MAGHDIIVVGASAGGVEPLTRLLGDLPRDLAASVFVVLHMSAHGNTALPQVLARRAELPVAAAVDGEKIEAGRVYVAVPDRHLFLEPGVVRVVPGPKENGHRPSIDGLFRTAAAAYGPRVIGVVLSGSRDDGTVGLRTIYRQGGRGLIQDPEEAPFPGMPQSALDRDHPEFVLPVDKIAGQLVALTEQTPRPERTPDAESEELDAELRWAHPDSTWLPADPPLGRPSGFTCPECHGGLWELEDGDLPRYRCRIGHGFSAETLLSTQSSGVEAALWTAYRALEERAALCRRLADRAETRRARLSADRFGTESLELARQAGVLRAFLAAWPPRNAEESDLQPEE